MCATCPSYNPWFLRPKNIWRKFKNDKTHHVLLSLFFFFLFVLNLSSKSLNDISWYVGDDTQS
jgi:hypothetical protein